MGDGHWEFACLAALLLLTNIAAINLARVVTFLLQDIRPKLWREEKQARKATQIAILLWGVLLGLLVLAIALADPISN